MGKMKRRGRLALGDVSCAIGAHKCEWYCALARPLQRAEALAGGLKTGAKLGGDHVDVVSRCFRRGKDFPVRHGHRGREILPKSVAAELAGGWGW